MTDIVYAPIQQKPFTALHKYALKYLEYKALMDEKLRLQDETYNALCNLTTEIQMWLAGMSEVEFDRKMKELERDWNR